MWRVAETISLMGRAVWLREIGIGSGGPRLRRAQNLADWAISSGSTASVVTRNGAEDRVAMVVAQNCAYLYERREE